MPFSFDSSASTLPTLYARLLLNVPASRLLDGNPVVGRLRLTQQLPSLMYSVDTPRRLLDASFPAAPLLPGPQQEPLQTVKSASSLSENCDTKSSSLVKSFLTSESVMVQPLYWGSSL